MSPDYISLALYSVRLTDQQQPDTPFTDFSVAVAAIKISVQLIVYRNQQIIHSHSPMQLVLYSID